MANFFRNKSILLISPEPWNHLFISKHHYAIELSKENQIYFLNPPGRKWLVEKTKYKNIWVVNYPGFVSGLRHFPSFAQKFFFKNKYNTLQNLVQIKFDCIWSFDNSVFFDFSFLPESVFTITHVMDYSQNFQLERASQTAKLCMAVSQNIVDLLKPHNSQTFLMPHGIAGDRTRLVDVHLPGVNSIKAIFAGNLDRKHFDKNLLLLLARKHPEVDFVFYGSGGKDWERLKNTFYPGVVDFELMLNYFVEADVLLLPYKFEGFERELTNSHKVLDYLRSGNVIVSSYLDDYADHENLLRMAKTEDEFVRLFSETILQLDTFNNTENRELRKKFASKNSYTQRLVEIEKIISIIREN